MQNAMRILSICLIGLIGSPGACAQSDNAPFTVFDPNRGREIPPPPVEEPVKESRPVTPTPPPKPPAPPLKPQKNFILEGSTQIGSRYTAILRAPDGKKIIQKWRPGSQTPIEGYEDYILLAVRPREVQLRYPDDTPCKTSQNGLQCSEDGKTATLALVNAKARPPRPVAPSAPNPVTRQSGMSMGGMSMMDAMNPFTQQRNINRSRPSPSAGGRPNDDTLFRPQRIKDEDVPPGMRVIRTPFGDRLVPSAPAPKSR